MPQPSRHRIGDLEVARQALRDQGIDPDQVSLACTIGQHSRCKKAGGKVMLAKLVRGRRYRRCACPTCNHPAPRVRRLRTT